MTKLFKPIVTSAVFIATLSIPLFVSAAEVLVKEAPLEKTPVTEAAADTNVSISLQDLQKKAKTLLNNGDLPDLYLELSKGHSTHEFFSQHVRDLQKIEQYMKGIENIQKDIDFLQSYPVTDGKKISTQIKNLNDKIKVLESSLSTFQTGFTSNYQHLIEHFSSIPKEYFSNYFVVREKKKLYSYPNNDEPLDKIATAVDQCLLKFWDIQGIQAHLLDKLNTFVKKQNYTASELELLDSQINHVSKVYQISLKQIGLHIRLYAQQFNSIAEEAKCFIELQEINTELALLSEQIPYQAINIDNSNKISFSEALKKGSTVQGHGSYSYRVHLISKEGAEYFFIQSLWELSRGEINRKKWAFRYHNDFEYTIPNFLTPKEPAQFIGWRKQQSGDFIYYKTGNKDSIEVRPKE